MPFKPFLCLGLLALNRYDINLSNEILDIDFDQGAAKISEIKISGDSADPRRIASNRAKTVKVQL